MKARVLKVPYDSGHRCERMARGPGYLLANKVLDGLPVQSVETALLPEVQCAFDLARQISPRVQRMLADGELCIVLSGNCNSALGTIAGLGPQSTGVLWFDAHGEFNTPETTSSGFFDGMALAVATGRCWRTIAQSIPGYMPLPEHNVILAGVRQTDPEEQTALDASRITQARELAAVGPALEKIAARVRHWYVHLDLDALDPSEATANEWTPPQGLLAGDIEAAIQHAAKLRPIAAVTVASLDPACDADGRALAIARRLLSVILGPD